MRLMLWLFALSLAAFAQAPASNIIDRLNNMSPEQRRKALNRMPPARRQLIENKINNLNKITPEARQKLRKDYEYFQQLPPEKQDEARRTLRQIADLPEERRRMVRGAINNLRQQTAEVQQQRMSSRAFNNRFSEDEVKLIRDAVTLLPPPQFSQPTSQQ